MPLNKMKKYVILVLLIFLMPFSTYAGVFTEINDLMKKGEYDMALNTLTEAEPKIKSSEKYLLHYYKAKIYFYTDDNDKSIIHFKKSIELKPDWYLPYHDLGFVYQNKNNFNNAIIYYKKSIKRFETYPTVYLNLGNVYFATKKYESAIINYQESSKYEKNKDVLSDIYYRQGKAYSYLKDNNKAIACFEKSIKAKPNWHLPYHDLGLVYHNLNNHEEAISYYNKALLYSETFPASYINLGNIYLVKKDYAVARENYQKALESKQDKDALSETYLGLGDAYMAEKNYTESVKALKKAIKHKNDNWKAYMNLGLVYFNQDIYDDAIENFNKVIQLNSNYYLAYFYKANCYRGLRKYPEMEKNYKLSLQYQPDNKDVLYSLSTYYAFIDNKNNMLEYLKLLFSVDEQYKNIIMYDTIFENYQKDKDFLKLVKGQANGTK